MDGAGSSRLPPADDPPDAAPYTRLQRMLLTTDGTVTHVLESFADEPVEVVKLLQELHTSTSATNDAELELDGRQERVLRRRVLLRGAHTGRNLLYAEAVIVLDRVDAPFLDGLVRTDKPIGMLLAALRMETFREILRVGREPSGTAGVHFGLEPDDELISRTYRIISRLRPIILITEKFPPSYFRDLPE